MSWQLARGVVSALAAAALASCGGSYAVQGAGATPVAHTSVVDDGLFASVSLGAAASSVITGLAIVAIVAAGNEALPPMPLRMKEDRSINEQDCTQPIADFTANLKCR